MDSPRTIPTIDITELVKRPYLTEADVAEITRKALPTLRNERHLRRGIPYLKIGIRGIRYRTCDVLAYMESVRITF